MVNNFDTDRETQVSFILRQKRNALENPVKTSIAND